MLLFWCYTRASIVHRVNGRSIANAGARGAGDVTPALPVAADARRRRACAPPRDPESPKKAAPQDLFTTPGYHASPSTRCLRHVRRRSSRECRTARHTACRVSDPMCKSWFVGRGSRASTTPTPEPPATDVDSCGDTHGSDLSRQIDRRGSPCIFRSSQHLAAVTAVPEKAQSLVQSGEGGHE